MIIGQAGHWGCLFIECYKPLLSYPSVLPNRHNQLNGKHSDLFSAECG